MLCPVRWYVAGIAVTLLAFSGCEKDSPPAEGDEQAPAAARKAPAKNEPAPEPKKVEAVANADVELRVLGMT